MSVTRNLPAGADCARGGNGAAARGVDYGSLALPAVLLGASLVLLYSPERGVAVVLALAALAVSPLATRACGLQVASVASWWQQAAAKQTGELWGYSVLAFTRDKVLFEEVMGALSEVAARIATDPRVMDGLKQVAKDLAADDEFGRALLPAVGKAAAAASKEPLLHQAAVNLAKGTVAAALKDEEMVKDVVTTARGAATRFAADHGDRCWEALRWARLAVADALRDRRLMDEIVATFSGPVMAALRNEELRSALVGVTKDGVSDALDDGKFVGHIRDVLCECLQAPHVFRSAAAGVVTSLNPFVRRGRWEAEEKCA